MPNPINDLATMLRIAKERGIASDTVKNKLMDNVVNFRRALLTAKRMGNLKTSGAPGTNTGPIAGRIPDIAVDIAGSISPEYASGRRKMSQELLNMFNPYRKEVTGAQAAVQELARYIEPEFPRMKDEDEVFTNVLGNYKSITRDNLNEAVRLLQMMNVPNKTIRSLLTPPTSETD